jgi:two-component sensor histidine kinase
VLNIDAAIPCGLILNELVANALEHAFPHGRKGEIQVRMGYLPNQRICLSVRDNGVGLAAHLDMARSESLGLRLVHSLVDQIGGSLDFDRQNGTCFTIVFRDHNPSTTGADAAGT